MINIAKLLKNCPKGTKLYSPLFGEVKFLDVDSADSTIIVETERETHEWFFACGEYKVMKSHMLYSDAECLLFPSKECRTWKNFKLTKFKFKVEDWIVRNNGSSDVPIQVDGLKVDRYLVTNMLGSKGEVMLTCQDKWHLWTIQDAKDGDVLIDGTTNTIGIFKEINKTHWYSKVYCGNATWGSIFSNGGLHKIEATKPATKEQRDLLFQKIKEAEYEWDSSKKELRKIKPHYDIANFKPYDKVLIRVGNNSKWTCDFFSYYHKGFHCIGCDDWSQCIPFDGNEHLLGTTNMPSEEYINW